MGGHRSSFGAELLGSCSLAVGLHSSGVHIVKGTAGSGRSDIAVAKEKRKEKRKEN